MKRVSVVLTIVAALVLIPTLAFAQALGTGPNVNLNQKGPLTLFQSQQRQGPVVVRASTLLDGKGATLHNMDIVIEDGKIARILPSGATPATYDLTGLTVLPGFFDTHLHPGGHFDLDGRAHREMRQGKSWATPVVQDTPQEIAFFYAENLYALLQAGFTTVESPGSRDDMVPRLWAATRGFPGPRIRTSLDNVNYYTGTPEVIREFVRKQVKDGADFIKMRASMSIRGSGIKGANDSGKQIMSDAQIQATCEEATALGKPSMVHVQNDSSAYASTLYGCTAMEHGVNLTDKTLDLMKEKGTWLDPHNGLLLQNYIEYKQQYVGQDNFTEQGYEYIQAGVAMGLDTFKRALAKGVKMVFGTDGNAGSIGRNYEEMIWRAQRGGQKPMDVIVDATYHAAQSQKVDNVFGSIAPGLAADIIALDGDPIADITAVRRAVFVMKDGRVYKNIAPAGKGMSYK